MALTLLLIHMHIHKQTQTTIHTIYSYIVVQTHARTLYVLHMDEDELWDTSCCLHSLYVCLDQMGKRRFSGLEVTLMVMFALVLAVAVALVIFLALGEPAVIKEGG